MQRSPLLVLLVLVVLFTGARFLEPYNVHWLKEPITIERDVDPNRQSVHVYCYPGIEKSILALWQTMKFQVRVKNDEFHQYIASQPEDVYKEYTDDSYGWSVPNPFQRKAQKTVSIPVFDQTCMAINTKQKYIIELQVLRVDLWRIILMTTGIALILSSRALSGNPVFFYICGILVGVFASFMVLVYYVSKLLPRKTLTYGILIGGWTVGVYVFQQIWENLRTLVASHQAALFWYALSVGLVSFVLCYRLGPPRDQRTKNLVMWTLQVIGLLMIFFSSDYQEAATAVIIITLVINYFPASLIYKIRGYWCRRFPPRRAWLTSEQYYEQGARETQRALTELRRYCASPDCAQWRIMLKLNDSKRFASFVEGNSHLSDEEVMDYEAYAFSTENVRKPLANSTRQVHEISDDDSSESDYD